MASGAWEWGGANSWSAGRLEFSSSSNGSAANSSNVTVRVYARRSDGGSSYNYDSNGNGFWVQADGQTHYASGSCAVSGSGWQQQCAWTFTVGHNNDGTRSVLIAGGGSVTGTSCNISAFSVWVNLDRIPRYTSVTKWECESVTQTTATFNWTTADTVDWGRTYLNNSGQHTDIPASVNATSGSFTYKGMNQSNPTVPEISTLSPNTTYNIKFQVRRKDSGLWTTSNNIQFTTAPIASITNENINFNIGESLTLNFQNHMSNLSYICFDIQNSDETWDTDVVTVNETIQAETYILDLTTTAIKNVLYSALYDRNSANVRVRVGTTINGTKYENTTSGVMSVVNSNPVFSNFTYGNTDTTTNGVLGNSTYMVKAFGNMRATISTANKAIALNQANVVKYVYTITDATNSVRLANEVAYSATNMINIEFGAMSSQGTYKINIQAVDSRGNTSSIISKTFYVLDYHIPYSIIKLERVNGYERETSMDFSSTYSRLMVSSVAKNNSFTIKYRYKEKGADTWGSYISLTGYTSAISPSDANDMNVALVKSSLCSFDDTKAYDVQFVMTDRITSVTQDYLVSEGIPIMIEATDGHVAVGMIPEWSSSSKFQVASDIKAKDSRGINQDILYQLENYILVSKTEPTDQMIGGIWFDED